VVVVEIENITSHSSRTNNSWLFAPSSLILANHYLPLNGALCVSLGRSKNVSRYFNSSIYFFFHIRIRRITSSQIYQFKTKRKA